MAAIPDDWYFFPQASIREMARLYAGTHPFFSWDRYQGRGGPRRKSSPAADEQVHAGYMAFHTWQEPYAGGAGSADEPVDGLTG